jgi:hypothetical protein
VPVVSIAKEPIPGKWLIAGPLPAKGDADALDAIGGCAEARPGRGTEVTFAGAKVSFQSLDRRAVRRDGVDLAPVAGAKRPVQCFLYTVLAVEEPTSVVCETDGSDARLWLAGRRVEAEHILRLAAGRYPLLVRVVVRAGGGDSETRRLKVSIRPSLDPDGEHRRSIAFVRKHARMLRRVVELAPSSPQAARAAELLKQAGR